MPFPERLKRWIFILLPLVLLAVAGWVLVKGFADLNPQAVLTAVGEWGPWRVAAALVCCVASFAVVGAVEWFAVRHAGGRAPFGQVMLVSFIANGFGHVLGANLLVAGAVRARLYARYKVDLMQAAEATLYQGVSFALGLAALTGAALITGEVGKAASLGGALTGALLLAGVGAYLLACARVRGSVRLFKHTLRFPGLAGGLAQLGLGIVDACLAIAVIWVLIPAGEVGYLPFAVAYCLAYLAGLLSGVPAGAGLFESVLLKLLPGLDHAALAAAFLGFRLFYYLAPLALAALLLLIEALRRRAKGDPIEEGVEPGPDVGVGGAAPPLV